MTNPVVVTAVNALWRSRGGRIQLATLFLVTVLALLVLGIRNSLAGSVYAADDRVLVVGNRVSPVVPVSSRIVDRIRSVVGADSAVAGVSFLNGRMSGTRLPAPTILAGADFVAANPDVLVSRADLERWRADRSSALIGDDLARVAGLVVGDRVPVDYGSLAASLKGPSGLHVAGTYQIRADRYAAVGLVLHDTLLTDDGRAPASYAAILVNVAGGAPIGPIARQIDLQTAQLGVPTRTALRSEYAQLFNKQSQEFEVFLRIAFAASLATALVIALTVTGLIVRSLARNWTILHLLGFPLSSLCLATAAVFAALLVADVAAAAAVIAVAMVAFEPAIRTVFAFFTIGLADYGRVVIGGAAVALAVAVVAVAGAAVSFARRETAR